VVTATQTSGPAVPATGRPWRWYASFVVGVALLAVLTTPLRVSGWVPWGQSGAAARPSDPTVPPATSTQEVPGHFQEDVLQAAWSGPAAWPMSPASGTVTVDAWVGRLDDADPIGDYYVVHVVTSWTHVDGMARLPAPVQVKVASDTAAISNVHGATRTFVSAAGCDAVLTLPATVGARDHVATASACRGYGVRLLGEDETSAAWRADQPAGLHQVELVYAQKVPDGARPVWTVELTTPTGHTASDPWHADPIVTSTVSATVQP